MHKSCIEAECYDHGTYFTVSVDGEMIKCISCNSPLEHVKKPDGTCGACCHKCSKIHEGARSAQAKRTCDRFEAEVPEAKRISDGFWMMGQCENDE